MNKHYGFDLNEGKIFGLSKFNDIWQANLKVKIIMHTLELYNILYHYINCIFVINEQFNFLMNFLSLRILY